MLLAGITKGQRSFNPMSDTIRWEYSMVENLVNNESVKISGWFVSYGEKKFEWIQDDGAKVYTFYANSKSGTWTSISDDGDVTYYVTFEEVDGTIKLYRKDRKLKIELDFVQPDKQTPHVILIVDSNKKPEE
jgi:hypothetical protein